MDGGPLFSDNATVGAVVVAPDGTIVRSNGFAHSIFGRMHLGRPLSAYFHPDDCPLDFDSPRFDGRLIRADGLVVWVRCNSWAMNDLRTMVIEDVTKERILADQQKVLLDELNHRVKNTLANVQSISLQTLRSVNNDPQAFRERFQIRLLSLSRAHDLLTQASWDSVHLRDLLKLNLAPYAVCDNNRLAMSGDDVYLNANAAVTMNMVFHELATNASKYGSLSNDTGTLEVTWRYDDPVNPKCVRFSWIERGGPVVPPPSRQGFGTRMILTGPKTELWATTTLNFDPEGVTCLMELPFTMKVKRSPPGATVTTFSPFGDSIEALDRVKH